MERRLGSIDQLSEAEASAILALHAAGAAEALENEDERPAPPDGDF